MRSVEITETQAELAQLIDELEQGDGPILLLRNGKPIARLLSITEKPERGPPIGVARAQFAVPDDIDTNNDDVRNLFYR